MIDVTYQQWVQQSGDKGTCPWLVDISQDASQRRYATYFRGMRSSSCFFFFPLQRIIAPRELLQVLGIKGAKTKGLSPHMIKDLCGEAFAAPCATLVLICTALGLEDTCVWKPALPVAHLAKHGA